jgi:hypothetical protein
MNNCHANNALTFASYTHTRDTPGVSGVSATQLLDFYALLDDADETAAKAWTITCEARQQKETGANSGNVVDCSDGAAGRPHPLVRYVVQSPCD